jgi:DNA-binding NarL/FixJ family response regulator
MSIRILVADDHTVMRQGLCTMLAQNEGFEIVGEAENGRSAVRLCADLRPDVVIMDVSMPDMNGIEATRQVMAAGPGVKVVALSVHTNKRLVLEMLQAGAVGYLLKSSDFEELIQAVRLVIQGKVYLSPDIAGVVVENMSRRAGPETGRSAIQMLTPREREVLQLLAEGKKPPDISKTLFVSVKTVEAHRRNIMRKLKADSLAQLTKIAIQEGLTSPEL